MIFLVWVLVLSSLEFCTVLSFFFFLMLRHPPRSPLFPYPPLFRFGEGRPAAGPAASSHSFITVPPWMNPALLASVMPIHLTSTALGSEAGRASPTPTVPGS